MSKTTISIIIYVLGLIFGALFLDMWSAETSPKALWCYGQHYLISLYYLNLEKVNFRSF